MPLDPATFNLNEIPGFTEQFQRHLAYLYADMENRVDGDEWGLDVHLRFKRDDQKVRCEISCKLPRPEKVNWISRAVAFNGGNNG